MLQGHIKGQLCRKTHGASGTQAREAGIQPTAHGGIEPPDVAWTPDKKARRHKILQGHMPGREGDIWCCRDT